MLGSVQVPAGGQPLIFLADHPTTGGYPVVGVVHPDDLWLVAQARPGTTVRFHRCPARPDRVAAVPPDWAPPESGPPRGALY